MKMRRILPIAKDCSVKSSELINWTEEKKTDALKYCTDQDECSCAMVLRFSDQLKLIDRLCH